MKFKGQIALFKGGACFNDFLKCIVATGVETFRIYSYMIEPSAQLIKGKVVCGSGNQICIQILKVFDRNTRLGVTDGSANVNLLVRTSYQQE